MTSKHDFTSIPILDYNLLLTPEGRASFILPFSHDAFSNDVARQSRRRGQTVVNQGRSSTWNPAAYLPVIRVAAVVLEPRASFIVPFLLVISGTTVIRRAPARPFSTSTWSAERHG